MARQKILYETASVETIKDTGAEVQRARMAA